MIGVVCMFCQFCASNKIYYAGVMKLRSSLQQHFWPIKETLKPFKWDSIRGYLKKSAHGDL